MVKRYFGYLIALFLLTPIVVATESRAGQTEIIWSDSFDNFDSLTNWEITHGNWTVDNGALVVNECVNIPPMNICFGSIWRTQTQMTGTLSFDVLPTGLETFGFIFHFIGNGFIKNHPYEGYVISLSKWHDVSLDYTADGGYKETLAKYTPSESYDGWIHFDITRDQNGEMIFYVNNTQVLRTTHNLVTVSENISISAEVGVKFDNINFTSEIKPKPAPGFEVIVVVGTLILSVNLRKRKRVT
ncbi:MAG: hypothetical protein ACXACR_09305 [Candidatus Hodarchaeales archaeon]|jgi:hypothetical protein